MSNNTNIKVTENEKVAINVLYKAKGLRSDIVFTDVITSKNLAVYMSNLVRKGLLVVYKDTKSKIDFGLTKQAADFIEAEEIKIPKKRGKSAEETGHEIVEKVNGNSAKKPQSAYAIMLDILCKDPNLTKDEFRKIMDSTKIEYKETAFTTAYHSCRSIFRRLGLLK